MTSKFLKLYVGSRGLSQAEKRPVHVLLFRSYPDFIQILSKFYSDFIKILSRLETHFILIHPDFILMIEIEEG